MDLNKVMLIGRLTRDPESRTLPQGATVTNFGLATGRVWKDKDGNQQERTEFHNIVTWQRLAEICAQYLAKGRQVYIEGNLQTRSWEDADGKKNYRTEVVASNMIMLGSKGEGAPAAAVAQAPATQTTQPTQPAETQPQQQSQIQEPVVEPVGATQGGGEEEEIRIEDIPF